MARQTKRDERSLTEFLRSSAPFQSLTDDALVRLAAHVREQTAGPGQIVFLEGEPGEAAFFVRSGRIKISTVTPDGDEMIMGIMRPGDMFGAIVLFGAEAYPATAQALERAVVARIPTAAFRRLAEEAGDLDEAVRQVVGQRLLTFQRRLARMGTRDARYRLLATLCDLAEAHGRVEPSRLELPGDLTHQQLAGMIGTSRETVSRLIAGLKADRLVGERDGCLVVHTERLNGELNRDMV